LRPPRVTDMRAKLIGYQRDELVFQPLPSLVGERQVVGVRADAELARLNAGGASEKPREGDTPKEA
jgi:hypothetical protein